MKLIRKFINFCICRCIQVASQISMSQNLFKATHFIQFSNMTNCEPNLLALTKDIDDIEIVDFGSEHHVLECYRISSDILGEGI